MQYGYSPLNFGRENTVFFGPLHLTCSPFRSGPFDSAINMYGANSTVWNDDESVISKDTFLDEKLFSISYSRAQVLNFFYYCTSFQLYLGYTT